MNQNENVQDMTNENNSINDSELRDIKSNCNINREINTDSHIDIMKHLLND